VSLTMDLSNRLAAMNVDETARSIKATDEIAAQIVAVQNATRDAVRAIHGIGATIGQISEIAAAIAEAVEGQ
jgi:hypothetical protein